METYAVPDKPSYRRFIGDSQYGYYIVLQITNFGQAKVAHNLDGAKRLNWNNIRIPSSAVPELCSENCTPLTNPWKI